MASAGMSGWARRGSATETSSRSTHARNILAKNIPHLLLKQQDWGSCMAKSIKTNFEELEAGFHR